MNLLKNLFILCLFASTLSFAEVCVSGRSTSWDATGASLGPNEKCYIKVNSTSSTTLSTGFVVTLDSATTNPYDVTAVTTAGAVPHCVLMETCALGAKCKCQTYGYMSNSKFKVTVAASTGHLVFLSETSAGYIQAEGKSTIAASDVPIGVFMETVTSTGDAKIFIKLR